MNKLLTLAIALLLSGCSGFGQAVADSSPAGAIIMLPFGVESCVVTAKKRQQEYHQELCKKQRELWKKESDLYVRDCELRAQKKNSPSPSELKKIQEQQVDIAREQLTLEIDQLKLNQQKTQLELDKLRQTQTQQESQIRYNQMTNEMDRWQTQQQQRQIQMQNFVNQQNQMNSGR